MSLEQEIAKLREAVVELTAEMRKHNGGKATPAPKAEAPKAEAPKAEAPKAEAPKAESAEVTETDVQDAFIALMRKEGGKDLARKLLTTFGVPNVMALTPEARGPFHTACTKALAL